MSIQTYVLLHLIPFLACPYNSYLVLPASQHGIHLLRSISIIYKRRPKLSHFRQLQRRSIKAHVPIELGKDMNHVVHLEPLKQKVKTLALPVFFEVILPLY